MVSRDFRRVGQAGAEMEDKVTKAARGLAPALKAVDAAAGELKGKFQGFADSAGGVGKALSAMGPAGVAGAAGIGALSIGFVTMQAAAREAVTFLADLANAADSIPASTDALQEWRFAAIRLGQDAGIADAALGGLNKKLGEIRAGGGAETRAQLERLGFTEEQIAGFDSVSKALPLIAERLARVGAEADRANIADKLGLAPLLPVLSQGAERLNEVRLQAERLGVVLEDELIQGARETKGEWDAATYAMETQFRRLAANTAPFFASLQMGTAQVAAGLNDALTNFWRFSDLMQANIEFSGYAGADRNRPTPESLARAAQEMPGAAGAVQGQFEALQRDAEAANRKLAPPAPTGPDPVRAAIEARITAMRAEIIEREKLADLQRRFPGLAADELTARRQLEESLKAIDAARAKSIITTDAEAASLRANAQAAYDQIAVRKAEAEAIRVQAAAQAELERAQDETRAAVLNARAALETPRERYERERAALVETYRKSQAANDAAARMTEQELAQSLDRLDDAFLMSESRIYQWGQEIPRQYFDGLRNGFIENGRFDFKGALDGLGKSWRAALWDVFIEEPLQQLQMGAARLLRDGLLGGIGGGQSGGILNAIFGSRTARAPSGGGGFVAGGDALMASFGRVLRLPGRAGGGPIHAGQWALVGEGGRPELVRGPADVIGGADTAALMRLARGGAEATGAQITWAPTINAPGASAEAVDAIRAELIAQQRQFQAFLSGFRPLVRAAVAQSSERLQL